MRPPFSIPTFNPLEHVPLRRYDRIAWPIVRRVPAGRSNCRRCRCRVSPRTGPWARDRSVCSWPCVLCCAIQSPHQPTEKTWDPWEGSYEILVFASREPSGPCGITSETLKQNRDFLGVVRLSLPRTRDFPCNESPVFGQTDWAQVSCVEHRQVATALVPINE